MERELVHAKESRIIALEEARLEKGDYGGFRIHMQGDTAMTENSFSSICTLYPREAVHSEHRHAVQIK